jgi:hypothetical protein
VGQGYIHIVQKSRSEFTLETLKLHAESKGYNGFTLGRDGTWAANEVFFKKVDYQLTSSRVTANPAADCIWIRVPVGQEAQSQADHEQNNDTAKMVVPKGAFPPFTNETDLMLLSRGRDQGELLLSHDGRIQSSILSRDHDRKEAELVDASVPALPAQVVSAQRIELNGIDREIHCKFVDRPWQSGIALADFNASEYGSEYISLQQADIVNIFSAVGEDQEYGYGKNSLNDIGWFPPAFAHVISVSFGSQQVPNLERYDGDRIEEVRINLIYYIQNSCGGHFLNGRSV